MNRRRLLAGSGFVLSAAVSGCLGDGGSDETAGSDDENGDERDDAGTNDTERREIEPVEENPRADEPPHEITPQDDEDRDDWNDDYLGERMETEPSLSFDSIPVTRRVLGDRRLTENSSQLGEYWVELIESEGDRNEFLDIEELHDEESRERLETVDFDESVLIVLETGYGSSSVRHRFARIEGDERDLHLHGYYTDPHGRDGDISTWVSVLEVEQPDTVEIARVSLTVARDLRVHFNSTEGVVRVD